MNDALTYAINLMIETGPNELETATVELHNFNAVINQKRASVAQLTTAEVQKIFTAECKNISHLITELHTHKQLKLLPKIQSAFHRLLENNGLKVVELSCANPEEQIENVKNQLGKNTIVISKADPKLLAGIKITSSDGTSEFSFDLLLKRIKEAIVQA
jgi:F0F1-type ATP synthase delta subunit